MSNPKIPTFSKDEADKLLDMFFQLDTQVVEVTEDCPNPYYNRTHSYGMEARPTIAKGTQFVIKNQPKSDTWSGHKHNWVEMEVSCNGRKVVAGGKHMFADLKSNLRSMGERRNLCFITILLERTKRLSPNLGLMLSTNYGMSSDSILATLVDQGRISLDELKTIYNGLDAKSEEEYVAFRKRHSL